MGAYKCKKHGTTIDVVFVSRELEKRLTIDNRLTNLVFLAGNILPDFKFFFYTVVDDLSHLNDYEKMKTLFYGTGEEAVIICRRCFMKKIKQYPPVNYLKWNIRES